MFGGGRYRAALAAGRPIFTGIDTTTITWPDGSTQQADVILLATGCRPELGYPTPLGALAIAAGHCDARHSCCQSLRCAGA